METHSCRHYSFESLFCSRRVDGGGRVVVPSGVLIPFCVLERVQEKYPENPAAHQLSRLVPVSFGSIADKTANCGPLSEIIFRLGKSLTDLHGFADSASDGVEYELRFQRPQPMTCIDGRAEGLISARESCLMVRVTRHVGRYKSQESHCCPSTMRC